MSEVLDERVVTLDFDNSKFEKNVKKSIASLKELDDQLAFKGADKGISKVEASISALSVVAMTVISRITNSVINLGTTLVKSLSVDNIASGWSKFGSKTTAVATMAAQTLRIAGKVIDDSTEKMKLLNEQLDKLNWFTDETSYNFTDMVETIGKFTAAGRDLDESVNAMMGIANWAALSGQNAVTASRAMYQLSQALGKGYIQLIDWRSIQNANMDTEEFRKTVLETAVAMGELTKSGNDYITKTGRKFSLSNFTDSLSSKWFTSDVLLASLEKYSSAVQRIYEISEETGKTASEVIEEYADELDEFGLKAFKSAQEARTFADAINSVKDAVSTGWMNTFEHIFGGYEESRKTWTELANELYKTFAESGNFRNDILAIWNDMGGGNSVFGEHGSKNQGAFWNLYDSIVSLVDIIKAAWNGVFGLSQLESVDEQAAEIAENLKRITLRIQDSSKKLKNVIENSKRLGNVLNYVFTILKLGAHIIVNIRRSIDPLIAVAKNIANYLFDRISVFSSDLSRIYKWAYKIENISLKLYDIFYAIAEIINPTGILNGAFELISDILDALTEIDIIETVLDAVNGFIKSLKQSGGTAESFKNIIKNIVNVLTNLVSVTLSLVRILNSILSPVLTFIAEFVSTISGYISGYIIKGLSGISNILQVFGSTLSNQNGVIKKFTNLISTFANVLKNSAKNVKLFVDSIKTGFNSLYNILKKAFNGLTNIFGDLILSIRSNADNNDTTLIGAITILLNGLIDAVTGLIELAKPLIKLVGNALSYLGKIFELLGNVVDSVFFGAELNNINISISNLAGLTAFLGALLLNLIIIKTICEQVAAILMPIRYLTVTLTDAIYYIGLSEMLNSISNIIRNIAFAMISLVASIYLLNKINLNEAAGTIAVLGGFVILISALVTTLYLMSKFVKGGSIKALWSAKDGFSLMTDNITRMASLVAKLSNVLIKIAIAMLLLSGLKADQMWNISGVLAAALAALTLAAIAISAFSKKTESSSLGSSISFIIQISVFLIAFSRVVNTLSNMTELQLNTLKSASQKLSGIIIVIGVIASLMNASDYFRKPGVKVGKLSSIIMSLSTFLILFVLMLSTINGISTSDFTEAMTRISSLMSLLLITELLIAAIDRLRTISVIKGAKASATTGSFAGITGYLLGVAGILLILTSIPQNEATAAIAKLAAIILIMTVLPSVIVAVSKFDKNKSAVYDTSKMMLSLTTLLLSVAGIILLLNAFNSESSIYVAGGVLIGIIAFLYILSVFIRQTSGQLGNISSRESALKKNSAGITKTILAISALLGTIAISIALLSSLDMRTGSSGQNSGVYKINQSVLALITVIAAVSAACILIKKYGNDINTGSINVLYSMSALLAVFAGTLVLLAQTYNENMLPAVGMLILGLVSLLTIIAVFMKAISKIMKSDSLDTNKILKIFIPIVSVITILTGILILLSQFNINALWGSVGIIITTVYTVLIAFGAFYALIGTAFADVKTDIANKFIAFISLTAGMLLVLATCIATIASLDSSKALNSAVVLAAAAVAILAVVGVLVALAYAAAPVVVPLQAIAAVIAAFGISLLSISVAMYVAVIAWKEFLSIIDDTIAAIPKIKVLVHGLISALISGITTAASELGIMFVELLLSAFKTLQNNAERFVHALGEFIALVLGSVLNILLAFVEPIVVFLIKVLRKIVSVLLQHGSQLVLIFITLIGGLLLLLQQALKSLRDVLLEFAISVIALLLDTFLRAFGAVGGLVARFLAGIVKIIGKVIKKMGNPFGFGSWLETAADEMLVAAKGMSSAFNDVADEMFGDLTFGDNIEDSVKKAGDSLKNSTGELADWFINTTDDIENMGDVLNDALSNLDDSMSNLTGRDNEISAVLNLDTTDADRKLNSMSSIFSSISGGSTLSLNASALANNTKASKMMSDTSSTSKTENTSNVYNSSFVINAASDPEETAREVDRLLQEKATMSKLAKGG